jgi:hypothetical protein
MEGDRMKSHHHARCLLPWVAVLCLLSTPATATRPRKPAGRGVVKRVFDPAKSGRRLPVHYTIANKQYLTDKEYRDLRDGCMALLKQYHPDKCFFVGMGRDPAPVIAFLQNLGEKDLAVNLPGTSNIGWRNNVQPADIARHVEAAIPAKILDGSRQLVLVDVTSSGKTPAHFCPHMERYLHDRGNPVPVIPLGMWHQDLRLSNRYVQGKRVEWFNVTQWTDFQNYNGCRGKYEGTWNPTSGGHGIAEHQHHKMGPNVQPPTQTNPNYKAFRKALLERMEQDPKLDAFVQELGARPAAQPAAAKKAPAKRVVKKAPAKRVVKKAPAKRVVKKAPTKVKKAAVPAPNPNAPVFTITANKQTFQFLSQQQYTELRDAVSHLMQTYPPSRFDYVFAGRSTAPLLGVMEALKPGAAHYLPFDGLRKLFTKQDKEPAKPKGTATLTARVRQFLGGLTGKPILLIRRTDSGKLLTRVAGELLQGGSVPVTTVALGAPSANANRNLNVSVWSEVVALSNKASGAEHVAPVVRKGRAGSKEQFTQNPQFAAFVKALSTARLSQDPALPKLKQLAGQ